MDKNNQIIKKFRTIHGDKYNYDKMLYLRSDKKIIITCPIHGDFEQTPQHHMRGSGCKKCGIESKRKKTTKTTESFIADCIKIYGDYYDYSKTEYIHSSIKVKITCPIHGDFEQLPNNFMLGFGCPKCSGKIGTTEEFIRKAKEVHGDKYSYHKVEYLHPTIPVWIHCEQTNEQGYSHGDFLQRPDSHLQGRGCPKCSKSISNSETELLTFIESLNIDNIITNSKSILNNNYELDIYIPEKKIAFEFDGIYWHNERNKPNKNYHLEKTEMCESLGIHLIHIFENEWIDKQEIVKSRVKNILGKIDNKIFARKCIVKYVDSTIARKFLNDNHTQGFVGSTYYYGLYYNNELVSLMTFGSLRKNLGNQFSKNKTFELLRFCNKINTVVIGAASKLFQYFINKFEPLRIISYADRRWSQGNIYETLGFDFIKNTVPNYYYVVDHKLCNRYNYRKDILITKYGCSPQDTEHNFCFNKGWYRIYDCGSKHYEWNTIIT